MGVVEIRYERTMVNPSQRGIWMGLEYAEKYANEGQDERAVTVLFYDKRVYLRERQKWQRSDTALARLCQPTDLQSAVEIVWITDTRGRKHLRIVGGLVGLARDKTQWERMIPEWSDYTFMVYPILWIQPMPLLAGGDRRGKTGEKIFEDVSRDPWDRVGWLALADWSEECGLPSEFVTRAREAAQLLERIA